MLIDLLQNDKEIHDLTMYGISGTHYNPEGDKSSLQVLQLLTTLASRTGAGIPR